MAHWTEQYIGIPYEVGKFDCMDLIVRVQKEVFGKVIELPIHSTSPLGRKYQIEEGKTFYVLRVDSPLEGDCVLLRVRGSVQHAGIVCLIGGEKWVLHNAQHKPHSYVQLQPERAMCLRGYTVEGYYRWK